VFVHAVQVSFVAPGSSGNEFHKMANGVGTVQSMLSLFLIHVVKLSEYTRTGCRLDLVMTLTGLF